MAERLKARGFKVDIQVGVSNFRIDLAVRHPREPSIYLAGIECDGATYHSSKSARDRDRLREEVLRDLKWEILRVWSTDWFADANVETEKLIRKLHELAARPLAVIEDVVFGSETASTYQTADDDTTTTDKPEAELQNMCEFQQAPLQSELPLTDDFRPLTRDEAHAALERFRHSIELEMPDAEPRRCILREAMIEHFIGARVDDPSKWFRIPAYLRTGCDAKQKRVYLERICKIVARMHAQ